MRVGDVCDLRWGEIRSLRGVLRIAVDPRSREVTCAEVCHNQTVGTMPVTQGIAQLPAGPTCTAMRGSADDKLNVSAKFWVVANVRIDDEKPFQRTMSAVLAPPIRTGSMDTFPS